MRDDTPDPTQPTDGTQPKGPLDHLMHGLLAEGLADDDTHAAQVEGALVRTRTRFHRRRLIQRLGSAAAVVAGAFLLVLMLSDRPGLAEAFLKRVHESSLELIDRHYAVTLSGNYTLRADYFARGPDLFVLRQETPMRRLAFVGFDGEDHWAVMPFRHSSVLMSKTPPPKLTQRLADRGLTTPRVSLPEMLEDLGRGFHHEIHEENGSYVIRGEARTNDTQGPQSFEVHADRETGQIEWLSLEWAADGGMGPEFTRLEFDLVDCKPRADEWYGPFSHVREGRRVRRIESWERHRHGYRPSDD